MKKSTIKTINKLSIAIAITSLAAAVYADPLPGSYAGLTKTQFDQWFPQAASTGYTYESLVAAFQKYQVLQNETPVQQVYNMAAFLANAAHESGNFQYATELGSMQAYGWATDGKGNFTGDVTKCQGAYGGTGNNCYYGRGALQLSHDGNYGVYGQGTHENPDLILSSTGKPPYPPYDNNLLMDSAVWFWSDSSRPLWPGKPRPVDGFNTDPSQYSSTNDPLGQAIDVINGTIECHQPKPTEKPMCGEGSKNPNTPYCEAQDRVDRFVKYLPVLSKAANVPLNPNYSDQTPDVVGAYCLAPLPPPPPLGPNHLEVNYTGGSQGWGTIQCFYNGQTNNVNLNTTASIQGTDNPPLNASVLCNGAAPISVTFTYNGAGSWVPNSPLARCQPGKGNTPFTLCQVFLSQQATKPLKNHVAAGTLHSKTAHIG